MNYGDWNDTDGVPTDVSLYGVDVSNTMRQKEREIINCADVLLEGLDVAEWYIH